MKYGKINNETFNDEICANCGGKRGLHNHMNQRCPKNINSNADHTEYIDTVFKSGFVPTDEWALRDIDLIIDDANFGDTEKIKQIEGVLKKYWNQKLAPQSTTPII